MIAGPGAEGAEGREDGRERTPPSSPNLPARGGLPPELAAEIRHAIVEARVSAEQRAASAPLRDLADAMRANAEALRSVQATQERIARAVDRSDRSEAVIQSTKALNETFRGVRAAQDALVGRLEGERRRPLRAALLAALLVALAAGGAGAFFLLREDDLRGRIEDLRAGMGTADREAWESSRRAAEADLLDRLEALSRRSSLTEAERLAAEKELTGLRSTLETLRRENETLHAGREEFRRALEERAALERENARLREELKAQRDAREKAERDVAARKRADLPTREPAAPTPAPAAAEEGPGGLDGAAAPAAVSSSSSSSSSSSGPSPPPEPAAGEGPPAEEKLPPTAVTDPGQVGKVLDGLNALLGGVGGRETYRVLGAKAVDGDRLVRARIEARGADGTVYKSFEAREARFVLEPRRRSLEIRLRDGTVTYLGSRTAAFLDGRYTAFLEVDPAPFQAAGNPLVAIP